MGRFDWTNWVMGLLAAFLGGGSGAIGAGFSVMVTAPDQFNLQHPQKLLMDMALMFFFSGLIAFMAKLHTNPMPTIITTTVETTQKQASPPATVKTIVTETKSVPDGSTDGGVKQN